MSNQAPSGINSTAVTSENTAYTLQTADFKFADIDGNQFAGVYVSSVPVGVLTLNGVVVQAGDFISAAQIAAGGLVYTPPINGVGKDYVGFQVQDNGGTANGGVDTDPTPNYVVLDVQANPATVINVSPVGGNSSVATSQNVAHVFQTSEFNFSDPGNNPANQFLGVKISSVPVGSLTLNGVAVHAGDFVSATEIAAGHLVYTPPINGVGKDYVGFQVQDNGGTANGGVDTDPTPNYVVLDVQANPAAVINISPVGGTSAVSTLEDNAYTIHTADFHFSDPGNNPANQFLGVKISSVPVGSLTLNGVAVQAGDFISAAQIAAGNLVYTPPTHAVGPDYVGFQVQDDGGTANGGNDLDLTPNYLRIDVTAPVLFTNNPDTVDFNALVSGQYSNIYNAGGGDDQVTLPNSAAAAAAVGYVVGTAFHGGDGNDVIQGGNLNDVIYGDAGDDTITGGAGNDTIYGGAGNNTLDGGDGNNSFIGDAVNGNDTVVYTGTTLDGSGNGITVHFNNDLISESINHSSWADSLTSIQQIAGSAGVDTLDLSALGTDSLSYFLGTGITSIYDSTQGSYVTTKYIQDPSSLYTIVNDASSNSAFNISDGNWHINGASGSNDSVTFLNAGDMTVNYVAADGSLHAVGGVGITAGFDVSLTNVNTLILNKGNDTFDASGSSVGYTVDATASTAANLQGGAGNDVLTGGKGLNILNGGSGNDVLHGGDGTNFLDGGSGTDTLYSGTGANTFIIDASVVVGSPNIVTIQGYHAGDKIDLSAFPLSAQDIAANIISDGNQGSIIQLLNGDEVIVAGVAPATLINNLENQGASDFILAPQPLFTSNDNAINFNPGHAVAGYTTALAGAYLAGSQYDAGGGNDHVILPLDAPEATASGYVLGTAFHGGAGDDVIQAGNQGGTVYGDAGNDTFISGAGADIFDGGSGSNTVDYSLAALSGGNPLFGNPYEGVSVDLNSATQAASYNSHGNSYAAGDTLVNVENITGSAYGDTLTGDANANILIGGAGVDAINGGAGDDTIIGGAGELVTNGAGGFGGGGVSSSTYLGDYLNGGDGIDTVSYATSSAGVSVDLVFQQQFGYVAGGGDAQGDHLSNFENITGSNFDDTLTGDAGANVLTGLDGNDTLMGRDSNDTLISGAGNDTLTGDGSMQAGGPGAGSDTFVFAPNSGQDTITDFQEGIDKIDVSGYRSDPNTPVAYGAGAGSVTVEQVGTDTLVHLPDGSSTITLQNITATDLTPTDFLF